MPAPRDPKKSTSGSVHPDKITVVAPVTTIQRAAIGLSHQTDVFIVDQSGALNLPWVVNAGAWNGPIAISRPGIFPREQRLPPAIDSVSTSRLTSSPSDRTVRGTSRGLSVPGPGTVRLPSPEAQGRSDVRSLRPGPPRRGSVRADQAGRFQGELRELA
jgi:hypothetical protein